MGSTDAGESSTIPIVDLGPFLTNDHSDRGDRVAALGTITRALESYGFFRVANHGVPPELMARALELSKAFFSLPDVQKRSAGSQGAGVASDTHAAAGYARQPEESAEKNEYCLMFTPELGYNIYPENPPELRAVLEGVFTDLSKLALLISDILSECMGLQTNFLRSYNSGGDSDILVMLRYDPATSDDGGENIGTKAHEDASCFTFVFQDENGGLQVQKDGEWVDVPPEPGVIVVNIGHVIEVLSNKRFKNATHKVVRKSRVHRHSFAFFFNADGEKWVEPLEEFTTDVGEKPKYGGFLYKDYLLSRLRYKNDKTHPPSRQEDVIHVTH